MQTHQSGCICTIECTELCVDIQDFQMFNSFLRTTARHLEILGKCTKSLNIAQKNIPQQQKKTSLGRPEWMVGPVYILRQGG